MGTIQDLLRGAGNSNGAGSGAPPPPPALSGGKGPTPIGVPKGYVAGFTPTPDIQDATGALNPDQAALANEFAPGGFGASQQGPKTQAVKPRYMKGYEWLPASMKPDQIAQIQGWMIQAGLLKAKGVQIGRWDNASRAAFTELLGDANASGRNWGDELKSHLQTAIDTGTVGGAGGATPNPILPIQLANPDDLKAVMLTAATNLMGHGLTPEEENNMVDAYHAIQRWNQTVTFNNKQEEAAANKGVPTPNAGGEVDQTAAQSPEGFIDQQIRQQHPTDVSMYELIGKGGLMDTFRSALSGWSGG